MHNLKPITPLGGDTPRQDVIGTITITEVVDQAMASVAARCDQAGAVQKALADTTGLTLPEVGQSTEATPFAAFWMGPDQWMVTAPHHSHELLAPELKQVVGDAASVVEQTDGWCRFDVQGAGLHDLFERLSNAPVRTMEPGETIRTTAEHLGVFLWKLAKDRMAVIGPRSSAGSLHHGLMAIAKSIA
ncbi:Sarcosine oxidase, gamma subunit family [Falsiruegeria litorea R37]|uniref:Sarcosine oxidase, gamma subunit family n=1 Tax=Falsiruegeria litorea R37 TaxID=1200284 RepID=A0A1Y5TTN7_9RHOB|nr:sarcosine oxidase subunit gamma [Falsiruegeria litorea]SLN72358.1 Sarcosine oxidase, gamma subunit family [Falsiruegeria litorea R37]